MGLWGQVSGCLQSVYSPVITWHYWLVTQNSLVAIFSVHFTNGLFIADNGYEYTFVLFAASVSLMFSGAGKLSLDKFSKQRLA